MGISYKFRLRQSSAYAHKFIQNFVISKIRPVKTGRYSSVHLQMDDYPDLSAGLSNLSRRFLIILLFQKG